MATSTLLWQRIAEVYNAFLSNTFGIAIASFLGYVIFTWAVQTLDPESRVRYWLGGLMIISTVLLATWLACFGLGLAALMASIVLMGIELLVRLAIDHLEIIAKAISAGILIWFIRPVFK